MGFGNRHSYAIGESLAKRTGGDLDTRGDAPFRMAGGPAPPLAEAFDLVQGEIIAGEMEKAIEEHGTVAGGEDEAVAVAP
jgi:hypothetical protein